jgi:hypothetical protein
MALSQNLEGYILGTITCPPEKRVKTSSPEEIDTATDKEPVMEHNPDYDDWLSTDQSILSGLMASLTEGIFSQVLGHNSSAALWAAVNLNFGIKSRARVNTLRGELFSANKGNQSITE